MQKVKRCITALLVALVLLCIIQPFTLMDVSYGATQYGYLISMPLNEVYRDGNSYKICNWGTRVGAQSLQLGKTITIKVHTLYNMNVVVTAGAWKNEKFTYVSALGGSEASRINSDIWFRSNGGTAYAYEDENWDTIVGDARGRLIYTKSATKPDSSGMYYVTITPTIEFLTYLDSQLKKDGDSTDITAVSAFKYKSVNSLGDPWGGGGGGGSVDPDPPDPPDPPEPDPEPIIPSTVRNTVKLTAESASVNYKNPQATLKAHGSITSNVDYGNDDAELDSETFTTFSVFGVNTPKDSPADATGTISGTLPSWLIKQSPIQYSYELRATGVSTLTNGASYTYTTNTFGNVILTNNKPSVNFNLKTLPGDFNNNQEVLDGYYYTNTPTKMSFIFSDQEDDITNVYIAVGKKESMDNNGCELSFSCENGKEPEIFVRDDIFNIISIEESDIYGYVVTVEFTQPGQYEYMAYLNDAYSNQYLTSYDKIQGSFTVRNGDGPEAPEAVITNPAYAFEDEPLNLTQNSTDPNGVDDIIWSDWVDSVEDVTAEQDPEKASEDGYSDITNIRTADKNVSNNEWYKRGGTVTFPTGSAHHYFKVQLQVKDATGLTDTTEQVIKVISNVPVASLIPEDGVNKDVLKENRSIKISAASSLAPSSDPIQWDKAEWTFSKIENGVLIPLSQSELTKIIDGGYVSSGTKPKEYTLQFYEPGVYEVGIKLHNNFSDANPDHEDTAASYTTLRITVVPDENPISSVGVTSGKPNFTDNPTNFTVSFRVNSYSSDGDIIEPINSYNWTIYEDKNNDGEYTDDERIDDSLVKYNSDKTEAYYDVTFTQGMHNKVKAVVTTTEKFGEAFVEELLYKAHGKESKAWERSSTVSTVETVNWIPDAHIDPPPSDESLSRTPYLPTDIDGDTVDDGYFIRAYTDDFIDIGTLINDEIPSTCKISWELSKKNHSGTYDLTNSSGVNWIQSSNVTHTLGLNGGTIRINSNGIYRLRMIVTDDMGDTSKDTIMIRIYPLPIGVLESNPLYRITVDEWTTKENIRFDFRANPTIVDDEWGVAWHSMNWSMDDWDVTPLDGQSKDDIHFTTVDWKSQTDTSKMNYTDQTPEDLTKFSGRDSQIGFGGTTNTLIDIVAITGLYGEPNTENNLEITTDAAEKFYSAAQKLADDISAKDPRYNVRFFKGSSAITTLDTFVTEIPYGFFDGFENTQDNEYNKYTNSYSITWKNEGLPDETTGRGTSGTAILEPNISKMNEANGTAEGFETAEDGYLTLLNGFDPNHENDTQGELVTKDMLFYGSVIVTAYNSVTSQEQLLYKADYGEFGTKLEDDLNNTKIAIFERNEDADGNLTDEWTVTGTIDNDGDGEYDYDPIVVSPDNLLILTIHFKGYSGKEETIAPEDQATDPWCIWKDVKGVGSDTPDTEKKVCGSYLAVGMRGWAGIYKSEQKNVTHAQSILETLKSIKYRPNATTVVLFATNDIINTPEMKDLMDLLDAEKESGNTEHWAINNNYTELIDYINSNKLKFITMTVGNTINKTESGVTTTYNVIQELHNDLGQTYSPVAIPGITTMGYQLGDKTYVSDAESHIGIDVANYIYSITKLVDNTEYRSCTFTAPGRYQITYWGTNYGNKTSLPAYYTITVMPDEDPIITADVADTFYRNNEDDNLASILLTGPDSGIHDIGDVPTITSPDGDYIDRVVVTFRFDRNNNGVFTDENEKGIVLQENNSMTEFTQEQLNTVGLTKAYYELHKLTR